jgi:putative hemolysin
MLIIELAIVLALVALNGFLAMSELALVSARRPLLEQRSREGSRGAAVALALTREPGRMLSAVQIGITLVGIIAGAFSGVTIAERLDSFLESQGMATRIAEPLAFVLVISVITYFSVVLGELVPKQVGLRNAETVAVIVARPMQILATVAAPLVALLDVSSRTMLRLLGQAKRGEADITDEEMKGMIEEAERTGLVSAEESSMLSGVMRMADRPVRAVMTPRTEVEWLDIRADDEALLVAVRGSSHSRLIACDGGIDEIVGTLTVRAALLAERQGGAPAVRALIQKVPVVSERLSAIEVIEQLRKSPSNLVVVIDEHGSLMGLVTEGDILKAIVADIEIDDDTPRIHVRDDGSLLIDGAFAIDELSERLGVKLPAHAYHTVAGFVLQRLRRLPSIGESFVFGAWRFEVVDVDGRRIDKVLATSQATLHRPV